MRALLLLMLVACDSTERRATKYLEGSGRHAVLCDGYNGEARCTADGLWFRCVVGEKAQVACEQTKAEVTP